MADRFQPKNCIRAPEVVLMASHQEAVGLPLELGKFVWVNFDVKRRPILCQCQVEYIIYYTQNIVLGAYSPLILPRSKIKKNTRGVPFHERCVNANLCNLSKLRITERKK